MNTCFSKFKPTAIITLIVSQLIVINICSAQNFINYDRLSFLETPQSYSLGPGTILFQGAIDLAYREENNGLAKFDSQQLESFLWYGTQLSNDWDVGASYRLNYDTNRAKNTIDEVRIFAQDQWGLISAGNISTQLYDQARRQIATGLLGSDQDNFTLPLESYGVFYQWATPDTQWMVAIDDQTNIELGLVYNKAVGRIDYKFSIRANDSENLDGDAQNVAKTQGLALVGQASLGRWTFDSQYMREQVELIDGISELSLDTVSIGVHAKFNLFSLSLTGIQKDNELSDTERSLSLGLRYDVARGFAINFGANIFNTKVINEDFSSYSASVQYQF